MKIQFLAASILLLFCATVLLPQAWAQSQAIHYTYNNGNPKVSYSEDANTLFQGPYTLHFRNGKVRSKGNLKDSKEQGYWEHFYRNGNPYSKLTYQDGLLQGKARYYYRNGVLKEEMNFEADLGQGPYQSFYRDGTRRSEGILSGGKFDGPLTTYRKDGTLKKVVTCNCGKKGKKKQMKD
jgi:antitoxin component YwqK of YwqJK toxin-antitoxin module